MFMKEKGGLGKYINYINWSHGTAIYKGIEIIVRPRLLETKS